MKIIKLLFLLSIISFFSCKDIDIKKSEIKIKTFNYKVTTTPEFFTQLINNHYKDFKTIDATQYEEVCKNNNLKATDSTTIKNFYTLEILHKLFTSSSAQNGSRGEILNIPYFWHWTNPNPRHSIILVETNQKLSDVKSPASFAKYKSFADIDRTPHLFLSELLLENPKYKTSNLGEFSTFGWCSEREMAFVSLLETLNIKGKVFSEGNHSWSEFLIPITNNQNKVVNFIVKIDNTFDNIEWEVIAENKITSWKNNLGNVPLAKWYNEKAHSKTEIEKIKTIQVSVKTASFIETQVVNYINKKIR